MAQGNPAWAPKRRLLQGLDQSGPAIPEAAPYLAELQKLNEPLLSREDEQRLGEQMETSAFQIRYQAREQFIQANLRLVVAVARKLRQQYPHKQVDMNDLIQDGNAALIHAVDKFDPARKVRFATYATWWVYQAMYTTLHQSGQPCRVPGNTLTQLNHLRRAMATLEARHNRAATDEELAIYLGVPVSKIQEWQRLSLQPLSLDATVGDAEGEQFMPATLQSTDPLPEEVTAERQEARQLRYAWQTTLTGKERHILQAHYGLPRCWVSANVPDSEASSAVTVSQPLHAIGKQYGVSREAIRKAERKALKKLQEALAGHRR